MKVYILKAVFFLCLLCGFSVQAQMEHCCKDNKKVKIKKQRKRTKGALVGVKGYDDKKATKARMKELKNAAKVRKQEKKLAAKEEEALLKDEPINNNAENEDPFENLGLDKPTDLKEEPSNDSEEDPKPSNN